MQWMNVRSVPSIPAGRCRKVLVAGSAAPGHVSASAGGAASLCSPARTLAPARPAGRWRTPAAPPPRPHPAERKLGQKIKQLLSDSHDLATIWTDGCTSATGGSSAINWERIRRVSRRTWKSEGKKKNKKKSLVIVQDVHWLRNVRNASYFRNVGRNVVVQDVEEFQQWTVGQILGDATDREPGVEQISEQQCWRVCGELPAMLRTAKRSQVCKRPHGS